MFAIALSPTLFGHIGTVLAAGANTWTKISDNSTYTDYVYGTIKHMQEFGGSLYFSPEKSGDNDFLMQYDGESLTNIYGNGPFEGYNGISGGLAAIEEGVFIIIDDESYNEELWGYNGTEWVEFTSSIPAELSSLDGIYPGPSNSLFLLAEDSSGEGDEYVGYLYDGLSWSRIMDESNSFGSFRDTWLTRVRIIDGQLVVLGQAYTGSGYDYVLAYYGDSGDGAEWNLIHEFADNVYPYDFGFLNEKFYVSYEDDSGIGLMEITESGSVSLAIDSYGDEDHIFAFLTQDENNIYIGTTKYDWEDTAELWMFDGEDFTQLSSYIGSETEEPYGPRNMVSSMGILGDELVIAAAELGEGPYREVVYTYTLELTDNDGDGIDDSVEDAAPNSGDANNDGTQDSEQTNVTSFVNDNNSSYISIEVDASCTVDSATTNSEGDNSTEDAGFTYPAGFVDFTADCGVSGFTTDVEVYFYGVTNSEELILKKYNSVNESYTYIESATIELVTVGSESVYRASYSITDGGDLDEDGTANGIIVDPVGLAYAALSAPNTGFGGMAGK